MASRRTRIKGIANIPQRKKNNTENISSDISTIKSEVSHDIDECSINVLKEKETVELISPKRDELNNESLPSRKHLTTTIWNTTETVVERLDEHVNDNTTSCNNLESLDSDKVTDNLNSPNIKETDISNEASVIKSEITDREITSDECKQYNIQKSQPKEIETEKLQTNIVRRKFLKPGINLNAVKKRHIAKETVENQPVIENTDYAQTVKEEISDGTEENEPISKPSEKVVVLSEIRIPKYENKTNSSAPDITKTISRESNIFSNSKTLCSEVTLNETHLFVNEVPAQNSSLVTFSQNIKKVVPETHVSDSEYPAPPPSPSKINRSRIKAIPRLSQRKTSCSASESEDDTRKYGRIRNNSVCSVVSYTTCLEPPTPTSESLPSRDVIPILQKKINRTEQSRKLAEARREFHKRFGANNPDKQRLKMIDLIFYNPTTNPMSQKTSKTSLENDTIQVEKESEENVDDPSKDNVVEEKENEADSSMPVPQIKIGPSGEIILDEQSLIVENAEVARQKQRMQNSLIIDGDTGTGYGIYKRVPRAVVWNQKETLRFYKALNLIGTDFTVMTQLFPKRTRRELKMKFKKEEKINKQLIDKAIMQPCNYNFADLKREIEIEEEEQEALQKLKEEEMKKAELDKQLKREKKRKVKELEAEKKSSELNNDETVLPPKKRLKGTQKAIKTELKPRKIKVKPLNIKSVLEDDSDADISDMDTQSESEEEETIPFLKPTRSGRMPKSTMRYTTINEPRHKLFLTPKELPPEQSDPLKKSAAADDTRQQINSAIRNRRSSSLSSVESNSERLLPGSVVIMTEEDPNGKSVYKVFMVTPEKKMVPLELESDVIARLIKERQSGEENPDPVEPPTPEINVTIPATDEKNAPVLEKQEPQEILIMNYSDIPSAGPD